MKRDMDVVRLILIRQESGESPPELAQYAENLIVYNIALMKDAGLVEAAIANDAKGLPRAAAIIRLTWAGHDFLDAARDDTLASRLVDHYVATYASSTGGDALPPLTAAACEHEAAVAGISPHDISLLIAQTPFIQLSNDLRDFASGRAPETDPANYFHRAHLLPDSANTVLDIGCSTGRMILARLAASGATLTGFDRSYFSLCAARAIWGKTHLSNSPAWIAGDVLAMPFDTASFSHVVSSVTLAHVPMPLALAEIHRVTKPGGQFVCTLEGDGVIVEMWDNTSTPRSKFDVGRVWLGHMLQERGLEWRGRPGIRRLAGYTAYSPAYVRRVFAAAGFEITELCVLTEYGKRPRLIGVTAVARG